MEKVLQAIRNFLNAMRGENTLGKWGVIVFLLAFMIVLGFVLGTCQKASADATVTLQWTTPQVNCDGSDLDDLTGYVVKWWDQTTPGTVVEQEVGLVNLTSIVLIGHSGGGVLAALLESRVDDVTGVISIGANLDIDAWTELHEYDQLTGSLNPIAQAKQENIPHLQLVGGRDAKVPLEISKHYSELKSNVNLVVYRDFDHVCCWEKEWPAILAKFSGESILIK